MTNLRIGDVLEPFDEKLGARPEPEILTLTEKRGFVLQKDRFNKRLATEDTSGYKVVRKSDIAFNPYLLWAGAIAQNIHWEEAIISPAYPTFRVRKGFDTRFVSYRLSSEPLRQRFDSISFGAVPRRRRAATDAFLGLEFGEAPALPKQRHIAMVLDKTDALRAKRRETIAKLDQLLKSVFLEIFGDPVANPKRWHVVPMSSLVKGKYGIKAGPFGSALKKEFYTLDGFRVYGQEQVIAGTLSIGDYYIDKAKFESLKSCAVSAGDLLISLVGSFGKILVVPNEFEPGIINPRLLKLTPDQLVVRPEFLQHYLQSVSVQRSLASLSHGGTMGILNAGLIKQLSVPLPPVSAQDRFISFLRARHQQEHCMMDSESRLDHLFRSLQQRAFSGQRVEAA